MDLKTMARDKLRIESFRGDSRAQLIGGSAAGLVVLLVVMLLVLATCGGSGSSGAEANGKGGSGGSGKEASEAVVEIAPKDGADEVATSGALRVSAGKGKLTEVTVKEGKGGDGEEVEGKIAPDGASWKPATHLATGTKYTVNAIAEDSEGRESAKHATFTTIVPKDTFVGYFTPENGDTVGAGMPVSVNFNRPIAHRETVEKAISVTAEPKAEIEGHWFGDRRLDFRPEDYWKSGTKVTLDLNLNGVEGSNGVYGKQRKTVKFTVGRQQVSVVDAKKKTMTVTRDGKKIKTIPITSGSPQNPTYNGKMVISEKYKVTRMNGDTVGFGGEYDIKDVPHAMRLSTSGTFIHGNYWTPQPQFGEVNASHGCVGLFDRRGGGDGGTPGAWFFKNSMVGDVVEVKNSNDATIKPDNGLNAWNMDWEEWTAPQ
ncbi:L,D-transpeptidase [Streptomyces iconiensis]|uniref:Ig-like domain-containing protein n=1 Tax=Streptomyces iconiensis TaxID=1384038 RepID=A0ABT7A0N4_9ACTN|nr:Ig-like domain-containing protein [Streptomyces iconiensis]MDJ1134879.1 Ig-like domain-containing protein [Streptomyces iconiensis]